MITLEFNSDADEFQVQMGLAERNIEIRQAAITSITEGLELGLDEVNFVEIRVGDRYIDFGLKKAAWKQFLSDSIEPLTQAEDYQSLIQIRDLIEKL